MKDKLATWFANHNGDSAFVLDWIGTPKPRDNRFEVDILISERLAVESRTGQEAICFALPLSKVALLCGTFRKPKLRPHRLTRGDHYRLDIAPRISSFLSIDRNLAAGQVRDGDVGWPFSTREQSNLARNSQVLAVGDPLGVDKHFCLIPCMEIVRYFFCASQQLANHVATGWDRLLWAQGCNLSNPNEPVVGVRRGLGTSVEDGLWLTQYLVSARWRDVADSVSRTLKLSNIASAPFCCELPLSADSTIQVEAISLPAATPIGQRFFVTRIIHAPWSAPVQTCWITDLCTK
jgi:hypothetical protein